MVGPIIRLLDSTFSFNLRDVEHFQTDYGVRKVREWANRTRSLSEDDLFISGDVDEILSREVLHQLSWCQTSSGVISGALWMPLGNFEYAYKSQFAVAGKPHMFGMPTIYRWGDFQDKNLSGRRLFTHNQTKFLAGGIHLTNPSFLPLAYIEGAESLFDLT